MSQSVKKRKIFGNESITEHYYAIKDFYYENRLNQVYQLENNEQFARLTLFNSYRYTKVKQTNQITVEFFCFYKKQWQKDKVLDSGFAFEHCSNISFFHFGKYFLPNVLKRLLKSVTDRLDHTIGTVCFSDADTARQLASAYIIRRSYILRSSFNHQKRIVKWLWEHMWDRAVVSMVVRIEGYGNADLAHYLRYQSPVRMRHLQRIKNETPNLIPLLKYIKTRYWSRTDLFSYRYWVSDGRLPHPFLYRKYHHLYCRSKAEWRWLKQQPRAIVENCFHNFSEWQILSTCQFARKVPVCVKIFLIKCFRDMAIGEPSIIRKQKLLVLFLDYIVDFWQEQGIKALRQHLSDMELLFLDIGAYLYDEGQYRGIPQTWQNLVARSEIWHNEIIAHNAQREAGELEISWHSPISSYWSECYADIEFTALTTGQALYDESKVMHHCVSSYISRCVEGTYLVFSASSKSERATLGLCERDGMWHIDQIRSYNNSLVDESFVNAAKILRKHINQLRTECV